MRLLAGRKAARSPRSIAVQTAADGGIIHRREELLKRWEDLFAAEFVGHTCNLAYKEARRAVEKVIQEFTLADV